MKKITLLSIILSFAVVANENNFSQYLLSQSLNRFDLNKFDNEKEVNEVSSWLVGLPTIQLSLQQSDRKLGTDECQISLNLPFKSRTRINLDKQLLNTSKSFKNIADKKKALFVSGLIRETIWNYKIAIKKRDVEEMKLDWLEKQQSLLVKLVQSGGSNLDLLFVEKQLLEVKLLILEFNQEAQMRLIQFQGITGETTTPEKFFEGDITDELTVLNRHPTVQQLQLAIEQSSIKYKLAGKPNSPINLSLTTLEINAVGANDRQYGIALEMPIGLRKSKTQTDHSIWLQEQNDLSDQLMTFERNFLTLFSELKGTHQFLNKKQALLERQSIKTKQIFAKLEQLRKNNELNPGLFFQRMIALITSIHQVELNQIYIYQNQSRQKQLAGVSL